MTARHRLRQRAGHSEQRGAASSSTSACRCSTGDRRQRDALNAQALAAANRYDATVRGATSQLREGYSAYRTAYDIARHYRDEIVPLRQTMAEENVLRYNGMLIGVFELLADARDQIAERDQRHRGAAAVLAGRRRAGRVGDRQAHRHGRTSQPASAAAARPRH